jgi:hypothetical protein
MEKEARRLDGMVTLPKGDSHGDKKMAEPIAYSWSNEKEFSHPEKYAGLEVKDYDGEIVVFPAKNIAWDYAVIVSKEKRSFAISELDGA